MGSRKNTVLQLFVKVSGGITLCEEVNHRAHDAENSRYEQGKNQGKFGTKSHATHILSSHSPSR